MTLTELLTKANIVKVEQLIGKNTAGRVGGLFQDLINYFNGKTNTWTTVTDPVDDIQNTVKEGDRWITGGMEKIRVNGVWELISFWKLDEAGNLYTNLNVYSTLGVSAYGSGTGESGGGGSVTVYNGLDSSDTLLALSANMGRVLNETKLNISAISSWALSVSRPTYGISEITGLTAEFSRYSLTTHAHAWSAITDKPSTFAPSAHSHFWADLTDKPSTFAPSAHSHLWADLTDKPATFTPSAHSHLWADLSDKPSTFTPSAHTHTKSQITDFGHTHLWSELTDKPTTFAPSAHTHLWANITDKPATFTPSAHTHAFADLTSKPTTLSGYGITDALLTSVYTAHAANNNAEKHLTAQQLSDLLALLSAPSTFWKLDVNGNLYTDKNVYSTLGISAYGTGTGGSGGGGASALYQLVDASISSPAVDHLLVFNGTHWQNRPKSYLLADYSLTTHVHTFASITAKPTTLSGYGITDAAGLTAFNNHVADGVKHLTATERTNWNTAYTNYHTHSNKSYLDVINQNLGTSYSPNFADTILSGITVTDKSVKNFINKFNAMFDTDVNGNIIAKTNLYSLGGISSYQSGAGVSGLTLQGDMNANGKNITNLLSVSNQQSMITMGYGSISFDIIGSNIFMINDDGVYANTSIEASGLLLSGTAQATEFKFGRYKFMEDTNGDLGIYNGTTKIATILKTRTNSNL